MGCRTFRIWGLGFRGLGFRGLGDRGLGILTSRGLGLGSRVIPSASRVRTRQGP